MIALLLAGVCNLPPLFDVSGPDCPAATQTIECQCSESMNWSPGPDAAWYDIGRQDPGAVDLRIVGSLPASYDDDGVLVPRVTVWHFAFDNPMPQEGQLYLYRVRACNTALDQDGMPVGVCSDWSARSVDYVAAPYVTTQFQPPIVGNP